MTDEQKATQDLDNASKLLALVQEAGEQTVLDTLRAIGYKVEPPVKPPTLEEQVAALQKKVAETEAEVKRLQQENAEKAVQDFFGRARRQPLQPQHLPYTVTWPAETPPSAPSHGIHRITCNASNAQQLFDFLKK